jgi:cytochrome c-type biogenesis protein CcmH/NrfG
MLSSRNIHFALLGIILGSASGYIFAFYQVQSSQPPHGQAIQSPQGSANLPQGHPNVSNEQLATMFKDALQKNPNDTTLLTRYANFLFDLGRFSEAVEVFQKVVSLQPGNLDVKTDLGTAQWNAGDKDAAMSTYQLILKTDPKHMATLHNLVIAYLEDRNVSAAERTLKQMEQVDPKYEGLDSLRKRLAEVKGK